MSWWLERRSPDLERDPERPAPLTAGDDPELFSITDFEASLDLVGERKSARRTETWLFVRAFLILLFVIGVVLIRQAALV